MHIWLILLAKKTAKQGTTGGEVCTDSPVHKVTFTRTSKSGTCITLVVSHNVNNVHVSTYIQGQHHKSKVWTVTKQITTVSKYQKHQRHLKNILGGGGSSRLPVVQFI